MRVLLDTNILIHREAATVVRRDIGPLFLRSIRLRYDKVIHPLSADEIGKHADPRVRESFAAKLASYQVLQTLAPSSPAIAAFAATDRTENDRNYDSAW
ncbi:MAG: hypothetical protein QM757_07960 [Paludibaculum sp.]